MSDMESRGARESVTEGGKVTRGIRLKQGCHNMHENLGILHTNIKTSSKPVSVLHLQA